MNMPNLIAFLMQLFSGVNGRYSWVDNENADYLIITQILVKFYNSVTENYTLYFSYSYIMSLILFFYRTVIICC